MYDRWLLYGVCVGCWCVLLCYVVLLYCGVVVVVPHFVFLNVGFVTCLCCCVVGGCICVCGGCGGCGLGVWFWLRLW